MILGGKLIYPGSQIIAHESKPRDRYKMYKSGSQVENPLKIKELKPGMENISVIVRVLESYGVRAIRTRAGDRTIGEYLVGDETGRVKLIAWGSKAAALAMGDVVEVKGAWVSVFRGEVQLNIGRSSSIERLPEEAVVSSEEIPDETPEAPPQNITPRRSFGAPRRGGRRGRGRRR